MSRELLEKIRATGIIGLWKDRPEMRDSAAYVRWRRADERMTWKEFLAEELERDPEFRRLWEEGEPEYQRRLAAMKAKARRRQSPKEMKTPPKVR